MNSTRFNYFSTALLFALSVAAAGSAQANPACEDLFNKGVFANLFSDQPSGEFIQDLIAGKTIAPRSYVAAHPIEHMAKGIAHLARAGVNVTVTDDFGRTMWGTIASVNGSSFWIRGQMLTENGLLIKDMTAPFSVNWVEAWDSGRVAGSTNIMGYVTSIQIQPELPKQLKTSANNGGTRRQRDFSALFSQMLDRPYGEFIHALIAGNTVAPKSYVAHPIEHMARGIEYLNRADVKVMITDDFGRTMWGTIVNPEGSSFKIYGRMLDEHGHLIEETTAPFSVNWVEAWDSGRVAGSTNIMGYVTSIRIQPELPKNLKSNPNDQGTELERNGGTLSPNHEKNAFLEKVRNGQEIVIPSSMSSAAERDLMQAMVSIARAGLVVQIKDSEGSQHSGRITDVTNSRFTLKGTTKTWDGLVLDKNEVGFSINHMERYQSNNKLKKPILLAGPAKE